MRIGSILVPALGLTLVACAPRYRTQVVGSGHVLVGAGASAAGSAPGGDAVALSATGRHRVTMSVQLPRALRVRYQLTCPGGVELSGEMGETFEAYRQRRLAELERQRTQKKQAVGALAGAVLGQANAAADVQTPNADARVEAHADGEAVGEAAADQALAPVKLDPRDTGARVLTRTLDFDATELGACSLSVASAAPDQDLTGVAGTFVVNQVVDLQAEARARHYAARTKAIDVRGSITASLVASGADPQKRARERAAAEAAARTQARADALARAEAEAARNAERQRRQAAHDAAQAKRDAERQRRQAARDAERAKRDAEVNARLRAQAEAKLEIEQRTRVRVDAAMSARGRIVAWLTRCGGDPNLQARLRAEEEARRARVRAEADARREAERQRRLRIRAEVDARREQKRREKLRLRFEAQAHRRQIHGLSIAVRGRLSAQLIGLGADPQYRDKMIAAEMRENEAHMRAAADAQRRAEIMLANQTQVALEARAAIASNLVLAGAVNRPPPPAPPVESRPPVPFTGAVWVAGNYHWDGIDWRWQTGHWTQPPRAGAVWVAPARVSVGGTVVIRPGAWIDAVSGVRVKVGTQKRKHRRVIIRDHRSN